MRISPHVRHLTLGVLSFGLLTIPGGAAAEPPKPPARPAHPTTAHSPKPAKPAVPAGYAGAVRAWHATAPGKTPPTDATGRPVLALVAINTGERVELPARTDAGGFAPSDLDRAARVLREPSSGSEHPMEPRLLDLVYRLETHFHALEVRVISGYRTPVHGSRSNHGKGRAMDLVIPGTTDEDVAKFARELGFVGVGVYPTSGFVHVDTRERSYFWVDASGPGRKNRERGILGDLAQKSDAAAAARGERPIAPYGLAFDVEAALREHRASSTLPGAADEDDTTEGD